MSVELTTVPGVGFDDSARDATTRKAKLNRKKRAVWLAFGALLALYVFSTLRIQPVVSFGTMHDDALYFSSAKALAGGQGYILPSFPVPLKATKYPQLYPAILAGIWKIDPNFPQNVKLAAGLTLAFGCAALLFAFLLLRRWPGLGDWDALGVTALCAFSSQFLTLSATVMADVPLAALVLCAVWLIDGPAGTPSGRALSASGAGLIAGLSVGFRSLGAAVVGGIVLALLIKREYRKLLWFSMAAFPVALFLFWPALVAISHASGTRLAVGPHDSGWTQTLCYYSSYSCNWSMDVGDLRELRAVAVTNLGRVIHEPGLYLLDPLAASGSLPGLVAVMMLSIVAYFGLVRYACSTKWRPLPIIFLLFVAIVLIWPYTPDRFLIAFLPLLFGGLWLEVRHLTSIITNGAGRTNPPAERLTAWFVGTAGLVLAIVVGANYLFAIPSAAATQASGKEQLLEDERGTYGWIKNNSVANAKVIAYYDGLAYLYTDHRAVRPIQPLTQSSYLGDANYAERDAARLSDIACEIGASYWLISADDFHADGDLDYSSLQRVQRAILANAPLVSESRDKSVRLYDIRRLTRPDCALKNWTKTVQYPAGATAQ